MADVDIDSFGEQDKTDKQPDTGKTIPFIPTVVTKTPSWEPEQETSFGTGKTHSTRLKNHLLKSCIESYTKLQDKPQKHSISTILNSEVESCTAETRAHP